MEDKLSKLTGWIGGFSSRSSRRNPSMSHSDNDFKIGPVQEFQRQVHVEKDAKGDLKGLPPDFQQMLESMTTAAERANAQNIKTAEQIIIWNKEQEKKNQQKDFMVVGMYDFKKLILYMKAYIIARLVEYQSTLVYLLIN